MAYKVRCSHCGKSMMLPEGDAGLPVVCLACGTKFVAPGTDGNPVVPPETAAAAHQPTEVPTPDSVEPIPVRPSEPGEPFRVPWAVVAIAVVVLSISGGLGWKFYQSSAARSGSRELASMLADARKLTALGDYNGAYQKYRDIDRRAIELGRDHQKIRELSDEGRNEQGQLLSLSRAQRSSAPSTISATGPSIGTAATGAASEGAIAATTVPSELPPATTRTAVAATSPTSRPAAPTSRRVVNRPALKPIPEVVEGVTDDQIGQAIQRGVDRMIDLFDPTTGQLRRSIRSTGDEAYGCGINALCVYALLQSGQAIPDQRLDVRGPFMKSLIGGMKSLPANNGVVTYARAIRATALALYNRREDSSALRADVRYLLMTHSDGAYSYAGWRPNAGAAIQGNPSSWDNSNSQYGLLGVWSGAEVGVEVPRGYWADVIKHWNTNQLADGAWSYRSGSGTLSMTSAGTASLFVAEDYLYSASFGTRIGREPFSPNLQRALRWWEKQESFVSSVGPSWGYTMYGIERVGLASGFKYFGTHDWYRELAEHIVARQLPNGTWGEPVDSAYALLFLSRGRHPILMNKLRFDKGGSDGKAPAFWGNRPRDAANLARYAGKKLERPLNWQVVTLDREWHDWLDSPILSIASHRTPYFTDEDCDKFRQYVDAGAMIYLQADGGTTEFDEFAKRFSSRLFPQYEMIDLPSSHPIYNVLYKVEPPPPLKAVTNGSRILMLYSPQDIARAWQMRDEKVKGNPFQLGVNLFIYAAGKRELRNRLSSPYIAPLAPPFPLGTIKVARLKYGGAWDPEPGAWKRFVNWFGRQTGTGLTVEVISLKDLTPKTARFAHLTGVATYVPNDEEIKALRAYVDAGGVLLIDSCGASRAFSDAMKSALARAFPDETLARFPRQHPLFESGVPGMDDLTKPRVRPYTTEIGQSAAATMQYLQSGNGVVVFSDLDIVSGLLGTQTWGVSGFDPGYSQALMKNLIFWTQDGKPGL